MSPVGPESVSFIVTESRLMSMLFGVALILVELFRRSALVPFLLRSTAAAIVVVVRSKVLG